MTIAKNHQVLRSTLDKKVLKSEPVTIDELVQFATVAQSSGRLADRVLFAKAKRLLVDEDVTTGTNAE
ncbi:hypothetical protein U1P98_09230 [Lysinibacillus irui]|uniref:Uncharacterized protein n=1 Tax=Lysinibacillus irui TaxID=2998077 RepID=A0ABU5NKC6_9BACI|nr:hypothetical protein [Lysinibacillus irui]MEA0554756.1 hypothetical protein [Lysinibacillus irui]MEA0976471.1 hypothetical protein [Lysinibacillus irui]MEA1042625.1 hypothetical protein [Lysinibacillus irui]